MASTTLTNAASIAARKLNNTDDIQLYFSGALDQVGKVYRMQGGGDLGGDVWVEVQAEFGAAGWQTFARYKLEGTTASGAHVNDVEVTIPAQCRASVAPQANTGFLAVLDRLCLASGPVTTDLVTGSIP